MAVCRVEKTKDYTTMSNFHLRDPNLSNKARGLLSTMLSLPEDWDYTTRGLAKICKDGVDGITAQLKELEQYGYLIRHIRYHRHDPRYPRSCNSLARQHYQRHHRSGNCVPR